MPMKFSICYVTFRLNRKQPVGYGRLFDNLHYDHEFVSPYPPSDFIEHS
jgi:hypothetical protein